MSTLGRKNSDLNFFIIFSIGKNPKSCSFFFFFGINVLSINMDGYFKKKKKPNPPESQAP